MKNILLKLGVVICLSACVNDSKFSIPDILCTEIKMAETHTLAQIKEMSGFGITEFSEEIIISGYVASSDASGNIYKTLYLQNNFENPTSAIKISIDEPNLSTKFPKGMKVYINLNGLALGYAYGSLVLGKAEGIAIERIPNLLVDQHIFRSCDAQEIIPKTVNISELTKEHIGMFVQLENIQFKDKDLGKTFAHVEDTQSVDFRLEQVYIDCEMSSEIILHTSGFSKFKNELIPEGKGKIVGILDTYYTEKQLLINSSEDVDFDGDRCAWSQNLIPNITIEELGEMYQNEVVEFGIQDLLFEGFIISSDEEQNFSKQIFIQDKNKNPTGGIRVLLEKENYFEEFQLGEKIRLSLKNLYMDKIDGVLTVGFYKNNSVTEIVEEEIGSFFKQTDSIFDLVPVESDLLNLNKLGVNTVLVKVNHVQLMEGEKEKAFTYFSGSESANRILEACDVPQKLLVFTEGDASFSAKKFPVGNGSIVGVYTKKEEKLMLQINSSKDVQFDKPYEVCPIIIPKILITEVADPENSVGSRFVELYNAGTNAIDLTGWKLNKYLNGAMAVSGSGLALTGIINPQEFKIISNVDFESLFGFASSVVSSYISANGDDVYELVDVSGNRHDIFGEIGTDGTGMEWEFTDGSAVRLKTVTKPSTIFNRQEWNLSSKVNNQKKQAPQDFNPGVW
ncbi:DUF5689 domain-containing protein [Bacteroidota bacterium]